MLPLLLVTWRLLSGNVETENPCICAYENFRWSCALSVDAKPNMKRGDICTMYISKTDPRLEEPNAPADPH